MNKRLILFIISEIAMVLLIVHIPFVVPDREFRTKPPATDCLPPPTAYLPPDTIYCPIDTIYRVLPTANFDTLTPTNISREIDRSEVEHPLIVLAQALWETENLGCDSCSLDRNNIFGFRKDSTHYLYFGTWQECVYYYARWQRRKGYKYGEDYFEFLRRKWGAKDPDAYVNAIRKKVKEIDAFGIYNEKR